MKIAVIGVGFVGGTVADFLEKHQHEVIRVDPKYYDITTEDATATADAAIICVNTPTNNGKCDAAGVMKVYEAITRDIPIMVKSTVTLDIVVNWPEYIVTNPEFLREATADQDFANQHTFIIGAEPAGRAAAKFFQELFQPLLPGCEFFTTDRTTASMVKYTHNAWLATKVAWFHELYSELPEGVDYDALTSMLARFPTVGASHMQAPNNQGRLGYGGSCFPKDVEALNGIINHTILQQVADTNNQLKKKIAVTDWKMKQMKKKIPNEPFMVFIGTSHTFGECDGKSQPNTFAEYVASQLGLKCLNVGMSGANNIELLQIVNELVKIDAFNENCRFVMLEPRLTDNTTVVQAENYLPWGLIKESIISNEMYNTPLLTCSKIGDFQHGADGSLLYPTSLNNYLYSKMHGDGLTKAKIRNIVDTLHGADPVKANIDAEFLEQTFQVAEARLAMETKNMYTGFADLVMVDSIKNIVVSKEIPFAWMVVDNRDKFIQGLPELYGGCTDVFDYMLFHNSALEIMLEDLGFASIQDMDFLRCRCHHLNAEGNIMLGKLMIPKIIDRMSQ